MELERTSQAEYKLSFLNGGCIKRAYVPGMTPTRAPKLSGGTSTWNEKMGELLE
jgi:hypothetical protein